MLFVKGRTRFEDEQKFIFIFHKVCRRQPYKPCLADIFSELQPNTAYRFSPVLQWDVNGTFFNENRFWYL